MEEGKTANGQFFITGTELTGFRAPDEDPGLVRPVRRKNWKAMKALYNRPRTGWQPFSVEIPDGITTIDIHAFEACYGLTSVSIPDTVQTIGHGAFYNCTSLVSIRIPGSVRKIEDSAFCGCTSLTDLSLPDGVQTIEIEAFSCCTSLTRVSIPDSVVDLGHSAFSRCTGLQEIHLPEHLSGQIRDSFGDIFPLFWRWLCGTLQVNASAAALLAEDVRDTRTRVWKKIVSKGDVQVLERYLAVWDRVPLEFLDKLIERSGKARKPEYTAVLEQYRRDRYSQGQ